MRIFTNIYFFLDNQHFFLKIHLSSIHFTCIMIRKLCMKKKTKKKRKKKTSKTISFFIPNTYFYINQKGNSHNKNFRDIPPFIFYQFLFIEYQVIRFENMNLNKLRIATLIQADHQNFWRGSENFNHLNVRLQLYHKIYLIKILTSRHWSLVVDIMIL